jgi:hypothetical protein
MLEPRQAEVSALAWMLTCLPDGVVMTCRMQCVLDYSRVLAIALAIISSHSAAQSNTPSGKMSAAAATTRRDGQHDFDFSFGKWQTHIRRRLHPLTGSDVWAEYNGTSVVSKLWNGRASLGETEADGPAGHLEALSLRLYSPQAHQWSLSYASSGGTTSSPTALSVPTVGEFKSGRGEFFDTESYKGRSILVRNVWSNITPDSIRFEQAFSEDGGRTWEENWIATDTRLKSYSQGTTGERAEIGGTSDAHAFDFEFGLWNTQLKLLVDSATGSSNWAEFSGTTVVHRIWGGRANLVELTADGSSGHFEGLNLRLYDPQSHQWSLNFANSKTGTLSVPSIGEFHNGGAAFYDMEPVDGRSAIVRLVLTQTSPDACRFEQAVSVDGGKTWEVNWTAMDTRVKHKLPD